MKHDINNLKQKWKNFKIRIKFGVYDETIITIIYLLILGCVSYATHLVLK